MKKAGCCETCWVRNNFIEDTHITDEFFSGSCNITLHCITSYDVTSHHISNHTTPNYTILYTTQHNTTQHNTTQHNTTQHKAAQHNVIYSTDLFCSFPAKNPCIPNPCLNEGACKRFGIKPTCACQKGFTGIHCQGIKNNPSVTVEYKMTVERFCFQA